MENKIEITVSPLKANLLAFIYILPFAILAILSFILLYGKNFLIAHAIENKINFFIIIFYGIFFHEILHGVGWALFTKKGFKSIKFGFSLKIFSPYSHCKEPLTFFQFTFGLILPGILLGILPIVLALIFKISSLLIYGTIFLFGAGGDLVILFKILRFSKMDVLIYDHPSKIGCIVIKKGDE